MEKQDGKVNPLMKQTSDKNPPGLRMLNIQPRRLTNLDRVVISLVLSGAAALFTMVFLPYLETTRLLFYVFATAVSAWWGGFISGTITAVVGICLSHLIPENTISQLLTVPEVFIQALLFLILSMFLSYLESFRQRYESLLEFTRTELETILNGVDDGITAQNPDGTYIYVNEAAADILDFSSAEVLKQITPAQMAAHMSFLDDQGQPVEYEDLPARQALKFGAPFSEDLHLSFENSDEDRWVRVKSTPITDDSGQPRLILSVLRDITQRRFFEEELLSLMAIIDHEHERLSTIMRNVPGIIWEDTAPPDTPEANISFISEYAERLLGYPISEWQDSRNIWETIIPQDVFPVIMEQTMALSREGDSGMLQFPVIAQDGRRRDMEASITFIRDTGGTVTGVRGVMMDVTERKRSERLLEKTTEELRRSNAELQQFAYIASHDLQEPLRMITSYLQLIERRYNPLLDDDGREFIHYAVDGATRMKALINDLLTYSRVQTQQREFTLFPLENALQTAMRSLKVVIEENHVTIKYDTLPQVYGDEILISQLLQNLLSNAIKFKREDPVEISIRTSKAKSGWWEVVFADNGIGIAPEYFERIFVIFQRLHTRESYPGTGIGLAICKKVVERHGGNIWLHSEVDRGTTFHFTLPASASAYHQVTREFMRQQAHLSSAGSLTSELKP